MTEMTKYPPGMFSCDTELDVVRCGGERRRASSFVVYSSFQHIAFGSLIDEGMDSAPSSEIRRGRRSR